MGNLNSDPNVLTNEAEVADSMFEEPFPLLVLLLIARNQFNPELVVYNAGTDILDGDPLGRLKISSEGVVIRDEKVFRFAKEMNVPIVMLTSGGYMKSSARVIADSITNLSKKNLIDLNSSTNNNL
ncbi:histone deacetylase 2-like [Dendrobium catenatum]|uniref:histone deacetylase 2-like n=1 Tax=Dendrobium catenatum TaxID=906689 RepID=UPI0009F6C6B8|nr:histone deacetylase 2-like [Dendrobium catenatum]